MSSLGGICVHHMGHPLCTDMHKNTIIESANLCIKEICTQLFKSDF